MPKATDYLSGVIGGNYLDPATNPHLANLTKWITDPIQAGLSAQFGRAGRGNSGDAARYIAQGMTSGLAAPLFAQYNTERGLQQGAAQMAPAMQAAGSLPLDQYIERLRSIGSMGQESKSKTTSTPSMGQTLSGIGLSALGMMGGNPMAGLGMSGLGAAMPWSTPGQTIYGTPGGFHRGL